MKSVECLVMMPVGSRSRIEYALDSIDSVRHYMTPSETALLVIDDTHGQELARCVPKGGDLLMLRSEELVTSSGTAHSTRGVLFVKQLAALERASERIDWRCLLRMDDDALIIGANPHRHALRYFRDHPSIGMLGAYQRRGDGSDKRVNLRRQGRRIVGQFLSRTVLRSPDMVGELARVVLDAKRNGYKLGDMCTGGALFLRREALERFSAVGTGRWWTMTESGLSDDLLLAMYTCAAGFRLADFSDADDVMAINWRGLPMPLDELVSRRKKVLHPVKEPNSPKQEGEVREFFREIRSDRRIPGVPG